MSNPKIIMPTETDSYNLLDYEGINAGYRADIIDAITQRMDDALKHHSQILTVPLVIRYPESIQAAISTHWEQDRQKGKHYRSNPCFNYFLEVYRKAMNAHEKRLLHYIWVMEKKCSINPHYHLILILNGNLMRYFAIPPFEVTKIWKRALSCFHGYIGTGAGLIHVSTGSYNDMAMKHGYLIHRDNADMLHYVLQHYSYFAKVNTKLSDPHVRCFGASTLKKGEQA